VDSHGRTIFVADAHRGDGKRFVVRADEKLTAFVELESVIHTKAASKHGIIFSPEIFSDMLRESVCWAMLRNCRIHLPT
jgi:hypothetical protein